MSLEEKIIVALDVQKHDDLNRLLNQLSGTKVWMKIGMELFYSRGEKVVFEIKEHGHKVFLDLKLHDIPNTVSSSIRALSRLPIDMINVHAAGGAEMMKRAKEASMSFARPPLLIAVTQLTSTSQAQMNEEQNIQGPLLESVLRYARLAKDAGLDGVVSSPLEVKSIKEVCGKSFLTITPGIRPLGQDTQDQKRVTTPKEALRLGTDYLVMGRPITQDADPKRALEEILKDMT